MKHSRLTLAIAAAAMIASSAHAQQYQQYQQVPQGYVLVPQAQAPQAYAPQAYAQNYQQQPNYGQQAMDARNTIGSLRGAANGAQNGIARGGLDGGLAAVDSILGFIGSQTSQQ